ncbi:MAG: branched-chain amino acid ABC transporter permease [Chloroflexi bacterium]|nr:branched-chain amino acid ABC transporter permease [Chloroflexota bacterium]
MQTRRIVPLIVLALLVALPVFVREGFYLDLLLFTFMYAAMSVGWDIMGGYAGYVSLGHVGFFGIGSYAAGLLVVKFGIPVFVSAPFVGLFAAFIGAGLGWVSLRARGTSFVIVTLTFTYMVQLLALNWRGVTGGSAGLYLPLLDLPGNLVILPFYYSMLILLVVAILVSIAIRRSKFGLGLVAIREEEGKADGSGVNTSLYKILAFAISVSFAGAAGALHAQYLNYVDPDLAFELIITLNLIIMSLVGSRGTVWGPVLGAFIVQPLSQYLIYFMPSQIAGQVHLIALGVVLVLVVMFMPDGIITTYQTWRRGRGGTRAAGATGATDATDARLPGATA